MSLPFKLLGMHRIGRNSDSVRHNGIVLASQVLCDGVHHSLRHGFFLGALFHNGECFCEVQAGGTSSSCQSHAIKNTSLCRDAGQSGELCKG